MSTAPPVYTSDAPPSYEEAVSHLETLIGSNRTATGIFEAAKGLSKDEITVLIQNHEAHFPLKTEEDKIGYAEGMATISSSDEVAASLEAGALGASSNLVEVHRRFSDVLDNIALLDRSFGTSFQEDFIPIRDSFQDVIDRSRLLAPTMSSHSNVFDNLDIGICNDESKDMESHKSRVKMAINKFEQDVAESDSIKATTVTVSSNLNEFVRDFKKWSEDREGELTEEIRQLKENLKTLQKELADAEAAAEAMTHMSQGIMGITGMLAAGFPPYSSVIALGGILFAGLELATTTALMLQISQFKHDISVTTKEIAEKEVELEQVRAAREALEETDNQRIIDFGTTVNALYQSAPDQLAQSKEILEWLEKGGQKELSNRPMYVGLNAEKGVRSCAGMGNYLRLFGRGINSICSPSAQIRE